MQAKQEIRSVEHGYMSHCFIIGDVTLAAPPLGSFIVLYVVLVLQYAVAAFATGTDRNRNTI